MKVINIIFIFIDVLIALAPIIASIAFAGMDKDKKVIRQ